MDDPIALSPYGSTSSQQGVEAYGELEVDSGLTAAWRDQEGVDSTAGLADQLMEGHP
jgi:hypothetical protein